MINQNVCCCCSYLFSLEASLKRITTVKSWNKLICCLEKPFFSNKCMQIVVGLRRTELLNQAGSWFLTFLDLHSIEDVFWFYQVEITETMAIKLLNWVENVNVVLLKNEFLETDWDHIENNSQRLFQKSLSVVLIKTRAIIHFCHHLENEFSWDTIDLPIFHKMLEIWLGIKDRVDDM